MRTLDLSTNGKANGGKTIKNGRLTNGQKKVTLPIKTVGKIITTRNISGKLTKSKFNTVINIRTDPSAYGMLSGFYPGKSKTLPELINVCNNKGINFYIDDDQCESFLEKQKIKLDPSQLGKNIPE